MSIHKKVHIKVSVMMIHLLMVHSRIYMCCDHVVECAIKLQSIWGNLPWSVSFFACRTHFFVSGLL